MTRIFMKLLLVVSMVTAGWIPDIRADRTEIIGGLQMGDDQVVVYDTLKQT